MKDHLTQIKEIILCSLWVVIDSLNSLCALLGITLGFYVLGLGFLIGLFL